VELALETLITLRRRGRDASLAIVGGPSGPEGGATLAALHQRVNDAGVIEHVSFVAPQSHQLLSTWMRAADVTLVPSRSESFGLVALESSACGTPVVASAVGGLLTLVEPGVNGELLASRDAGAWADAVVRVEGENADSSLSNSAVLLAQRYTWRSAAESLDALVDRMIEAGLVRC
jgi:D-inositol-3-phosphate glycosyltransferase